MPSAVNKNLAGRLTMFEATIAQNKKQGASGRGCVFAGSVSKTKKSFGRTAVKVKAKGDPPSTASTRTPSTKASRTEWKTLSSPSSLHHNVPRSVHLKNTCKSLSNRSLDAPWACSNTDTTEQSFSTIQDEESSIVKEQAPPSPSQESSSGGSKNDGENDDDAEVPRLLCNQAFQDNFEYYRIDRGPHKALVSTGSTRSLKERLKEMEQLAAKAPLDDTIKSAEIKPDRRKTFGTAKQMAGTNEGGTTSFSSRSLMSTTVPEETSCSSDDDEEYYSPWLLVDADYQANFGCYRIPRGDKDPVKTGSTLSLKDRMKALTK